MNKTPQEIPSALCRVAERRHALGVPQGELARRCGISRQFLSLVEAGRTQPNVQVALQLAAALNCSVEDLFVCETTQLPEGLPLTLVKESLTAGTRLDIVRINDRWVAHAADTAASIGGGFSDADGVLSWVEGKPCAATHRPIHDLEQNIAIAGCDPAMAFLCDDFGDPTLAGRGFWINCGSSRALELLASGAVHIAGLHYSGAGSEENLRYIEQLNPIGDWMLVHFTQWEMGWMISKEAGSRFSGTQSLKEGKLRLVNRENGAGARILLDSELRRAGIARKAVEGYDTEATSHFDCARALSEGGADLAIGPRAVAAVFGLGFHPLEEVTFDLVIPGDFMEHPRVRALLLWLRSPGFQREIQTLPGYRAKDAGAYVKRKK